MRLKILLFVAVLVIALVLWYKFKPEPDVVPDTRPQIPVVEKPAPINFCARVVHYYRYLYVIEISLDAGLTWERLTRTFYVEPYADTFQRGFPYIDEDIGKLARVAKRLTYKSYVEMQLAEDAKYNRLKPIVEAARKNEELREAEEHEPVYPDTTILFCPPIESK